MNEYIFYGSKNYEYRSLADISCDIEKWIKLCNEGKKLLLEARMNLVENDFWLQIDNPFRYTIDEVIKYFGTVIHDFTIIKKAIDNNCITNKEVNLLWIIGNQAKKYSLEIIRTYRTDDIWRNVSAKGDYSIAYNMYGIGRESFWKLENAHNAAIRLEDYMTKGQVINNSLSFHGNVSGAQIQLATTNSSQTMTENNDFDYGEVLKVLNKIKDFTNLDIFVDDFGEKSDDVKKVIEETILMVNNKEKPSTIKNVINGLKDLAKEVSSSIIANGIVGLITQLPI